MRKEKLLKIRLSEKGSLALEQVLFIGAIVTMSIGLFAFYQRLSGYFTNFDIGGLPTNVDVPANVGSGTGNGGTTNP